MNTLIDSRKAKRIDQKTLAEDTGISVASLSLIENRKNIATKQTKKRIELILGPINWYKSIKPKRRKAEYHQLENEFRNVLYGVHSLNESERKRFLKLIKVYLHDIENEL